MSWAHIFNYTKVKRYVMLQVRVIDNIILYSALK